MNDRGLIDDGWKMFASFCQAVLEKGGGASAGKGLGWGGGVHNHLSAQRKAHTVAHSEEYLLQPYVSSCLLHRGIIRSN